MPVILLQNETWLEEMRKFFRGDGAIFTPYLVLHGTEIQKMRRPEATGKETAIGDTVLDLERLRQYRVILTNYETITNYQHSFARMTSHWSVVVTDEAQEYKTPSTKISHALKSLYPRLLRIACTGTPVETRLLNVWNLFDFYNQGIFSTAPRAFAKQYESPLTADDATRAAPTLTQLKERLILVALMPSSSAATKPVCLICLRNTNIPCAVISHQNSVTTTSKFSGERRLVARRIILSACYLTSCALPNTQPWCLATNISRRRKRSPNAQNSRRYSLVCSNIRVEARKYLFLRAPSTCSNSGEVIGAEFGFHVDIINGATSRRGDTRSGNQTRRAMVQRFRDHSGFNVIVLSPDVAGIGLTLVEANHVIHYGRWWNPAKESQATDRVYRIGQMRDVHVYYPIATDPEGAFETFDEKLAALIQRRRQLAQDFLAPMPEEDALKRELFDDLFAMPDGVNGGPTFSTVVP